MNFEKMILPILLAGLFVGHPKPVDAQINAGNCKPLSVLGVFGVESVSYTDCWGRQHQDEASDEYYSFGVKLGTTVTIKYDLLPADYWKFPIENGRTIYQCSYGLGCWLEPPPSDCRPVSVTYNAAHYWATLYYIDCYRKTQIAQRIPTGGATVMAQNGTEVLMGPDGTETKDYLNYGKGKTIVGNNGLNITCWGWEGGKNTGCKTY